MIARFVVCPVHVGREQEVAALAQSAAAVRHRGGTLLICGDAGVGKTRLAAEAIRIARDEGFLQLTGQCVEGGTAAYAPLAAALRRHLRTLDRDLLEDCFAGLAGLAATLLPEIATELSLRPPAATIASEHLDAAVQQLLRNLTLKQPALVLLDDLHWASPDTIRMVASLIREASDTSLWIVGTYRTDELTRRHPLAIALSELGRQRFYDELRLVPLAPEQVGTMVQAIFADVSIGADVVDAIVERTSGNPFFVEELCRVIIEGRGAGQGAHLRAELLRGVELPWTIRETLLGRVRRLDAEYAQVLRIAAVSGPRIDQQVLRRAADVDDATVQRALVAGLESQLLVERREGASRTYGFRHELTREALSGEFIGPQRQQVHRQVAVALLDVHDSGLDEVAAELADHLVQSGDLLQARIFTVRAARHSAGLRAMDTATARYERALRLIPPDDADRLPLLIEAAEAVLTPDHARVAASFASEARALAEALGDRVAASRALRVQGRERQWAGDYAGAIALLEESRAAVEGFGDREEMMALDTLARRYEETGDLERARALVDRALAIAEATGDGGRHAHLYNTKGHVADRVTEAQSCLERALVDAEQAGDDFEKVIALIHLGTLAHWVGDVSAGYHRAQQALETAQRSVPALHTACVGFLATAAAMRGNYDEASDLCAATTRAAPGALAFLVALAEITLRRGHEAEARAVCGELARVLPSRKAVQAGYQGRAALNQSLSAARPFFMEAIKAVEAATSTRHLLGRSHWQFTPEFARALLIAGCTDELRDWVARVRGITFPDEGFNVASLHHCEGLLAIATGDHERARTLLKEVAAQYSAMPCPAREAEARLDLAEVECRTGHTEDAVVEAKAAHDIAARIGSPPLIAHATATLRRCGQRVAVERAPSSSPGGLSARELEIARLVAAGHSNAEIGKRLFLSAHTVRNHLSKVLDKLELRGRVEVATWVTEQGLTAATSTTDATDSSS